MKNFVSFLFQIILRIFVQNIVGCQNICYDYSATTAAKSHAKLKNLSFVGGTLLNLFTQPSIGNCIQCIIPRKNITRSRFYKKHSIL